MSNTQSFLSHLGLLTLNGFTFETTLGGGSALSCLYSKGSEKAVFKFLISPRNEVELERFKLECDVLDKNLANSIASSSGWVHFDKKFIGPETSYPLPRLCFPFTSDYDNNVNYFAYHFEDGTLLDDLDTTNFNLKEKIALLHRLASGLSYFNHTGYSHRDLHPKNILLRDGYSMLQDERSTKQNDPRVTFLDLGNCQRYGPDDYLHRVKRGLNEDMVFADNNKRLLSSFASMPPDFLELGEKTENYDTWAFGIYAYQLLFNEMPFEANHIGDITAIRTNRSFSRNYRFNLNQLPNGLKLIIKHLLSPNGKQRPSIDAIVRLFSWLVHREDEFQDPHFISQVIHGNGFDPNYDGHDE